MLKKIMIAALAGTALSAAAFAASAEPRFIFRHKAAIITPGYAGGGPGGDNGTPGNPDEDGDTGEPTDPVSGDGEGEGDDDEGNPADPEGPGDEGEDGEAGGPPAKQYDLVWVYQSRSPDDWPGADNTPPFADGGRQYAPDFLNLPTGRITMGDTIQICWSSQELWNPGSARSTIQFLSADNIAGSTWGSLEGLDPEFTESGPGGCFDLQTGGDGQDYGSVNFSVTVTSDWWGYPGAGWDWDETYLYEFTAISTATAVFFPIE